MSIPYSQERLRELLDYNEHTGQLTWKVFRGGSAKAGSPAGTIRSDGYRQICLGGRYYKTSHVIWKWLYNEEVELIDHKDTNPLNEAKSNLRVATIEQNNQNRSLQCNNTTGVKGLCIVTGGSGNKYYRGTVRHNGRVKTKNFPLTSEGVIMATKWLNETRQQLHNEFANRG